MIKFSYWTDERTKKMNIYAADIEEETLNNPHYRHAIHTGEYSQLVLMNIKPREEIGLETHANHDQFIRIESGAGQAIINGEEYELKDGSAVVIPAGAAHNIINTGSSDLKLYTIYSPPEHKPGTLQPSKNAETF